MSSGSALLSGSDFSVLDRFQFALTVTFFFCPVSAGIHLGNANIISTFIRKAFILGTDPAQGIPVMMWNELIRNYSCFHFSLMLYNTL